MRVPRLVVFFIAFASGHVASAAIINFDEWTPSEVTAGVLIRDQYNDVGLRVTGTDPTWSGKILAEGTYGLQNFGNSSPNTMNIGGYGHSTTLEFVSLDNPNQIIGATSVSFIMGDGHSDPETFHVSYYDTTGVILQGPQVYTTSVDGQLLSETSDTVGGLIGKIVLGLSPNSYSGVAMDDLSFDLSLAPVPEPSAIAIWALFGTLGFVCCYWRKRKKA